MDEAMTNADFEKAKAALEAANIEGAVMLTDNGIEPVPSSERPITSPSDAELAQYEVEGKGAGMITADRTGL
jgi:TRAP-type C4-dicarboxylate transport system substrate-binding protein